MDYGYSVYYKSGLPTEYVPYNISSSPVPQSGMADYWKKFVRPDRAGSLTTYNNAPAMIDFDPTDSSDARLVNFKRSDTTVCRKDGVL